jgi:hypothetical protein
MNFNKFYNIQFNKLKNQKRNNLSFSDMKANTSDSQESPSVNDDSINNENPDPSECIG